jgi:hypothetical protein
MPKTIPQPQKVALLKEPPRTDRPALAAPVAPGLLEPPPPQPAQQPGDDIPFEDYELQDG